MSSSPTVLGGMRAPRTVRLEELRTDPNAPRPLPQALAQPGINVYVARDRKYRVQITAPQHYTTPDGRRQSGGKMLVAVFDEGIYRNNHHDPATRALIDEVLQSNKYFGAFGSNAHFWLASDQNARVEKARIDAALDTLKALPKDAVDQFVAQLRQGDADDHTFTTADGTDPEPTSPAPSPKRGVRPIAG